MNTPHANSPSRRRYRSIVLAPVFGACLVLAACGDDGTTLGRYTVNEDLPEATVQGSGLGTLLPDAIAPFELDVQSSDDFPVEQDLNLLTQVQIRDVTLTIAESSEDPDSDPLENGMADDFSFIESLDLSIEAEIDGARQTVSIASIAAGDERLGEGSRTLVLDASGANILPLIEASGGYRLVTDANGTPPPDNVVIGGTVQYRLYFGIR